jgi:hypothetical protein
MSLMRNRLRLIVMLTAVIAIAAPASAQIAQPTLRASRPARGLFGGGLGDLEQSLVFNGSVGGGYDRAEGGQITTGPDIPTTVTPPWTGSHGIAAASLAYSFSRGRVYAGASADARARYRDGQSNSFNGIGASGNINWEIASRTSVSASQGFSRQPRNMQNFYGSWFDAESAPNTVFDLGGATSLGDYTTSQSAVSFQQGFTQRISLNAGYSHHRYYGSHGDPTTDSRTQTAAAGLSYQIARGIRFRIGYGHTSARYGTNDATHYGGLVMDGGLVFDRALSLTRRASLSFATGLTGARDEFGNTHYFATGYVTFSYELGRSWTAVANYRRGVDFNQSLGQPIVMDMVSAGLGGDLSRRFQAGTGVAASWGAIGISAGESGYDAYSASAWLRMALTRELGVSVNYAYRHYLVDDSRSLPFGMQPSSDRQSIRATLDLWLPLFTRARRPDASR